MLTMIVLSLAVASVSMTTSRASVFYPVRKWVLEHHDFLGRLAKCSYCTSHWVALLAVSVCTPVVLEGANAAVNFIVAWFGCVTLAAVGGLVIDRAYFQYEEN